jgi:hypothetical protein
LTTKQVENVKSRKERLIPFKERRSEVQDDDDAAVDEDEAEMILREDDKTKHLSG